DLDYSDRDLAFQSANGLMAAVSELNLLVQLKPEELDALSNLLCVVPETATKININTLKPEQAPLLVILLNGVLSEEAATQLLQQRPEQGWESVAQFLEDPALAGKTLPEDYRDKLAVQSTFFRATINVLYYDTQFSLQSLMEVQDKKSRVLSRRYGELF
ncbi:type II secretion system protein GspK, partial [Litorivivens sp.]